MTSLRRLALAVAVPASMLSLAVPAIAGAKAGDNSIQKTYPLATKLCGKVAEGTENKHLKKYATQVTADCAKLTSDFNAAQATVLAARASIEPQIAALKAATKTACPTPGHQTALCHSTRKTNEDAVTVLNRQMHQAARHYYEAVEASRHAFWRSVKSLPGEHHIRTDAPIDVRQTV